MVDIALNAIPSFMTLSGNTLTVAPTHNTNHVGTFNLRVTMTTPDSGPQTYDTVTVTVALCVVTELTATNAPSVSDLTYTIFSLQPTVLDVSSPGFNQVPACGYYLFNTFTWTIPPSAPITKSSSNDYQVIVNSSNASEAGTYPVTLSVSSLHGATMTTFTKDVSF